MSEVVNVAELFGKNAVSYTHLDVYKRQDFMGRLDGQGIGDKLVMETLENGVVIVRLFILNQADSVVGIEASRIKFIEWQPVINKVPQPLKQGGGCLLYTSSTSTQSGDTKTRRWCKKPRSTNSNRQIYPTSNGTGLNTKL